MAKWISFIAGIIHSVFSLYYFFVGLRLNSLYQEFGILTSPVNNSQLTVYLFFAVINFGFWFILKNKEKKLEKVSCGLILSVLLLLAPFLLSYLILMAAPPLNFPVF